MKNGLKNKLVSAYRINPRFRLKYEHKKVIIALTTINLKEHFIYYVIPLLEEVKKELKEKGVEL